MNKQLLTQEYRNIIRLLSRNNNKCNTLQDIQSIRHQCTITANKLHNINVFLTNEIEYNRLIRLYTPLNELSPSEKVARTANHVGLRVPGTH